jgi:hypothetical protein
MVHILVADMATIFTQVQGDDVGAPRLPGQPGWDRDSGTARIAQVATWSMLMPSSMVGRRLQKLMASMLRVSDIRMC